MSQHGRARPTLKGKKHSVSTAPSFEIAMTQGFSEPELFLHLLRAAVPFLPVLLLLPPSGRFRGPLASACFPRGGRRGSEQRATKRCPQKEAKKKRTPRPNQPLTLWGDEGGKEAAQSHPPPTPRQAAVRMRGGRPRPPFCSVSRAARPPRQLRRGAALARCARGEPAGRAVQANELKSRRRHSPGAAPSPRRVGDRLFLSPASFPFLAATAAPPASSRAAPRPPARPHHAVRAAAAQGEQPLQADPGEPPARPPPAALSRLLWSGEGCGCRGAATASLSRLVPASSLCLRPPNRPCGGREGREGGREAGRDPPPLPGFAAPRPQR